MIDLTGRKFGKLTVIKKAKKRGPKLYWLCKCECGVEKEIRGSSLKAGDSTSCGSGYCNGRVNDITGRVFGKITVLSFSRILNGRSMFNCKCSCGNKKEIEGHHLIQGLVVTCTKCNLNEYFTRENYMVGLTTNGEEFYFDIQDLPLISQRNWYMANGYVQCKHKNKRVSMHRFLLNPDKSKVVDHINGVTYDNRRHNIRICTQRENVLNIKDRSYLTGGYRGVIGAGSNKFISRIQKDGKRIYLGTFLTKEEAAQAYNDKAIELFGKNAKLNNIL